VIQLIVGGFIGQLFMGFPHNGLAFLGLTNMEEVSWGTNLFWAQNGNSLLLGAWWVFVPSGLMVALSALGLAWINFGMDEYQSSAKSRKELMSLKVQNSSVSSPPVIRREH
jgi:peptide/nickel transport system permease protein